MWKAKNLSNKIRTFLENLREVIVSYSDQYEAEYASKIRIRFLWGNGRYKCLYNECLRHLDSLKAGNKTKKPVKIFEGFRTFEQALEVENYTSCIYRWVNMVKLLLSFLKKA